MISKEQIKNILLEQRQDILKKSFGIEREILKEISKKIKLPHIIVLTGLRRVGKSTILRQIIKKYYDDKDFYYINFEDERFLNFKAEDFNLIYESLIELFGNKKTFFIDEIQNVKNFETFVRRFYDKGFKFFITGSNSELLSKEIGSKLTGRHIDIVVKPFSFREFLKLKKFNFEKNFLYMTEKRIKLKKLFVEYLKSGGMPEYLIFKDSEILMRTYEDIVLKDIVVRYGIEDINTLKLIYQYIITNFSKRFSYNSLNKIFENKSINTIKKFISYLEETHLIKIIMKFDYSLKKQIKNEKKVYVLDNSFINKISSTMTEDKGRLLENLVFNHLNGEVFYYLNKNECDFVIKEKDKITKAIQVCWELNNNNKQRELNGLLEAMDFFKLKKGLILTYDQEEEFKIKNKKIKIIPVWKWLLI